MHTLQLMSIFEPGSSRYSLKLNLKELTSRENTMRQLGPRLSILNTTSLQADSPTLLSGFCFFFSSGMHNLLLTFPPKKFSFHNSVLMGREMKLLCLAMQRYIMDAGIKISTQVMIPTWHCYTVHIFQQQICPSVTKFSSSKANVLTVTCFSLAEVNQTQHPWC